MKKTVLLCVCSLFCTLAVFSQNNDPAVTKKYAVADHAFYLGLGGGLNNPLGIFGVTAKAAVSENLMVALGLGGGSWGNKVAFTAYYITPSRWCPMFGIGRAAGLTLEDQELEVIEAGTAVKKPVDMNFKPVSLVNLGVQKQWYTPKGNHFYLELGYSLSLTDKPYAPVDRSVVLSQDAEDVLDFVSPGGLIFGVGYCLRLF